MSTMSDILSDSVRQVVKGQRRLFQKYEDNVETNSDSNNEFEDAVDSEPPPERTARHALLQERHSRR